MRQRELQNEGAISRLERMFSVKRKGPEVGQICRDNRADPYRQKRLYESNQKRLLNKLEETQRESVIPDSEESRRF